MAELDFSKIKTYSLSGIGRLVKRSQFAKVVSPEASLEDFLESLPKVLAADGLRDLAQAVVEARKRNKPVLLQFGGHMIKCGIGPLIIDLLSRGWITGLAVNGSVAIHDLEFAMIGATSEDVESSLIQGSFGMAKETAEFINLAAKQGQNKGLGLALGELINDSELEFGDESVIGQAIALGRPVTIHVAVGTDVVHQHPEVDGAALGGATLADFRKYCGLVADLGSGGVVVNAGSAVILPEVFLKAISVARNLGYPVSDFTAANLDIQQHYRTSVNVLGRPLKSGGKAISIIGHHEIVFPLLHAMVINRASGGGGGLRDSVSSKQR